MPTIRHSTQRTAWSTRSRPALPAASGQDLAHSLGQATRLEDLTPADTHGDVTDDSGVDVAVQVVPAVHGPLVAEPAVELDACPPSEVLDVAHRSTVRSLTAGLAAAGAPARRGEGSGAPGRSVHRWRRRPARSSMRSRRGRRPMSASSAARRLGVDLPAWHASARTATVRSSVRARDATRNKAASMRTRGGERYDSASPRRTFVGEPRGCPSARWDGGWPGRQPRSRRRRRGRAGRGRGGPTRPKVRPAREGGRPPRRAAATTAGQCGRRTHPGGCAPRHGVVPADRCRRPCLRPHAPDDVRPRRPAGAAVA